LFKSAPLHGIGKVGVPDRILLKPGKLEVEEFELMKLHTVYGRDAIISVESHLGGSNGFLTFAREIAYSHQEKWDGSGYPEGLKCEEIPISARLMAVADVYDALISKRVYKPAFSHEHAMDIMKKGRGTHFDPDVLDAFLSIEGTSARSPCSFAMKKLSINNPKN
jgi:putative two-component system response regulator